MDAANLALKRVPMSLFFKRYAHFSRMSKYFPAAKHKPSSKEELQGCLSQQLMTSTSLIKGGTAGTFHLLPFTTRALDKLKNLIDQEMRKLDALKINMPCLSPANMWKKSGRYEAMGSELLTLTDRQNTEQCLSPTHEEAVTILVADESPISYKQLPIKLYQIGRKFRDEMRPKHGLLRCREFEMKDLYTFDTNKESAEQTYAEVCEGYHRILNALGLDHVKVLGDVGTMGGVQSHEFHLVAKVGEDKLLRCNKCGKGFNEEVLGEQMKTFNCESCESCASHCTQLDGIEIGHAFILGTKYSEAFNAMYTDDTGKFRHLYMGCYGIGVTRLLAAAVEVLSTPADIHWPAIIAPHQICVIPQKEGYRSEDTDTLAESLSDQISLLPNMKGEVMMDDRTKLTIGRRVNQAKQVGFPYVIVVGKTALEAAPKFEFIDVKANQTEVCTNEQILQRLSSLHTIPL